MSLASASQSQDDFNATSELPSKKRPASAVDNSSEQKPFTTDTVSASNGSPASPSQILGSPLSALIDSSEKMDKRQRRLVKNREAAQMFRQRQKQYIQDLEKKINELSSDNTGLRAKLEVLTSENKLIRDQLVYLRTFIGQAVQIQMEKGPTTKTDSTNPTSDPSATQQ